VPAVPQSLGPTELTIMNEGPSQPQHPSAGMLSRDEVPWLDLVKGHENQLRYALAVGAETLEATDPVVQAELATPGPPGCPGHTGPRQPSG